MNIGFPLKIFGGRFGERVIVNGTLFCGGRYFNLLDRSCRPLGLVDVFGLSLSGVTGHAVYRSNFFRVISPEDLVAIITVESESFADDIRSVPLLKHYNLISGRMRLEASSNDTEHLASKLASNLARNLGETVDLACNEENMVIPYIG
jgi:hypothetical protein